MGNGSSKSAVCSRFGGVRYKVSLSANDKAEILDLTARCNHSFDGGNVAIWLDCYAPQGIYSVPALERHLAGHEALRSFAEVSSPPTPTQTMLTAQVIDPAGEGARMLSFFHVLQLGDSVQSIAVGRYEDQLEQIFGAWKIKRREAVLFWSSTTSGWA